MLDMPHALLLTLCMLEHLHESSNVFISNRLFSISHMFGHISGKANICSMRTHGLRCTHVI